MHGHPFILSKIKTECFKNILSIKIIVIAVYSILYNSHPK